jgi:hypothetical protein
VSTFEFILILFAIIIGFGISEILQGWGDQLRARRKVSALQVVASTYILVMSLRMLWLQWSLRYLDWGYGEYLLAASQPILFALAARVVRFDPASERSADEQYFQCSRRLFSILAAYPIVLVLRTTAVNFESVAGDIVIGASFVLASSTVLFIVFCWLAWSGSSRHHWIGLSVLWAVNLIWSLLVQPDLAGTAG